MAITAHVTRPCDTNVQIEAVRALAAISASGDKVAAAILAVGGLQVIFLFFSFLFLLFLLLLLKK